jgi:hypothetical protein
MPFSTLELQRISFAGTVGSRRARNAVHFAEDQVSLEINSKLEGKDQHSCKMSLEE